jgi:hypothetical protein
MMDNYHLKQIQRLKHQCHYQEQVMLFQEILGVETLMQWVVYAKVAASQHGTGIPIIQVTQVK